MAAYGIGGSFAPPITDAHLASWPPLFAGTTRLTRHALEALHNLVRVHRQHHQDSDLPGVAHPSGRGVIVPLHQKVKDACAEHLPTDQEMEVYAKLFDQLTGELRNAAMHLLWYAQELRLGREPITTDKI